MLPKHVYCSVLPVAKSLSSVRPLPRVRSPMRQSAVPTSGLEPLTCSQYESALLNGRRSEPPRHLSCLSLFLSLLTCCYPLIAHLRRPAVEPSAESEMGKVCESETAPSCRIKGDPEGSTSWRVCGIGELLNICVTFLSSSAQSAHLEYRLCSAVPVIPFCAC